MAQTLETLTRRTASMQGIRNIVHTMKTLSVINSAPYEKAARSIHVYHDTVLDGLQAFLQAMGPHGDLVAPRPKIVSRVIVAFGSDHGLCGSYNEGIAAHIDQYLDQKADSFEADETITLCVGAQLVDALDSCKIPVQDSFFPPASVDGIGRLANLLTQRLDEIRQEIHPGELSVSLAYCTRSPIPESAEGSSGHSSNQFSGHSGEHGPTIRALLPLDPALVTQLQNRPWGSRSLPDFAMKPEDLFRSLLRGHLFSSLFKAAAEALVTENAARLSLMQQAERSIDDRLDALRSEMRSLRQSEITSELLDVVIGFEALRKPQRRHKKRPDASAPQPPPSS
ncbi:FoF1 ATP synthase subunit gamma [Pseudophaeobacter sp.]|uniref:F0F1 ATP synthase subunit gamma n=1 Tax=Pseudophaeobacter sp. TaxID=1971739 RepID=UPI003298BA62